MKMKIKAKNDARVKMFLMEARVHNIYREESIELLYVIALTNRLRKVNLDIIVFLCILSTPAYINKKC